jgi:integral membrane protein (TIGR01906 family)
MKIAARWLFIVCLPVMLLTASVSWAVNSLWLYNYGFSTYEVGRVTGLAEPELEKAAVGLIDYFNSDEEDISVTAVKDGEPFQLFNEREVGHLRDVKGLFRLVYRILLGTFIYVMLYAGLSLFWRRDKRQLVWGMVGGGGLALVLMIALGLGTLFNFEQLFLQFHIISFTNDMWMLDPASDYLIMLFPGGFWFDAALLCALTTAVLALILGGLGWWLLRRAAAD